MNVVIALAAGVLTGAAVFLMLRHDIVKMIAGTLMLSNSAVLLLMAGTFDARAAPIHPLRPGAGAADPVLASLALTAVVITFGVTVLLLAIALAVERSHDTIDMDELTKAEVEDDPDAEGTR